MLKIELLCRLANLLTAARFVIQGDSMFPNLEEGQCVLVSRLDYRLGNPSRGDVVVLRLSNRNGRNYIKRIVGLPGEYVTIDNTNVYIDGIPVRETTSVDRVQSKRNHNLSEFSNLWVNVKSADKGWLLSDGQYFVVGDNWDASDDSRTFGPVNRDTLVGRVWIRYWPRNCWKVLS